MRRASLGGVPISDDRRKFVRSLRRMGFVCLSLALAALAGALPLHCIKLALAVGGFSFLDGALLGASLAYITRTRRPARIYAGIVAAALTFAPLMRAWPAAYPWEIYGWPGAPPIVYYYFDALRALLFLLGIPYPFGRWGQHGPDALETKAADRPLLDAD